MPYFLVAAAVVIVFAATTAVLACAGVLRALIGLIYLLLLRERSN
jgi:hypothetical protein